MQIPGEWFECDDQVVRPTFTVDVCWGNARLPAVRFVVDAAADRTALSADLIPYLPPLLPPAGGVMLSGVGGPAPFGLVRVVLEFPRCGMSPVAVRGEFAVFTEPEALDMPVLGRDVTDHFDAIVSRRRGEVLLLAGNHRYSVQGR